MKELRGIPASPGNAVAPAFIFYEEAELSVPAYSLEPNDVPGEWARFLGAVEKARIEVTALRDRALEEAGSDQAAIFESHLLMLSDPDLLERIEADLKATFRNSERVMVDIERDLVEKLSAASDPALRDRVADIHDVSRRILGHLLLRERLNLADLSSDVVLVARDLLPSDMICMNRDHVKAVATRSGRADEPRGDPGPRFRDSRRARRGRSTGLSAFRHGARGGRGSGHGHGRARRVRSCPECGGPGRFGRALSRAYRVARSAGRHRRRAARPREGQHRSAGGSRRRPDPRRGRHRSLPLGVPLPRRRERPHPGRRGAVQGVQQGHLVHERAAGDHPGPST